MGSVGDPLRGLLRRLDLDAEAPDTFVGDAGKGEGRIFGGMVAAQVAVAAGRTVADRRLHSLHAVFLRAGQHGSPIRFRVSRLRDGRTISTRTVLAEQEGRQILHATVSFTREEPGLSHQEDDMPEAPPPDGLPEWEDLRAELLGDASLRRPDGPIEVRVCDPDSHDPTIRMPARRRVWLRPRGTVPDDRVMQDALLIFASDRTLLRTAARPHGLTWKLSVGASLDHAVWLHRPVRMGGWILYVTESPVAHAGRALLTGAMYAADGARIVSVTQEGLLRA